jgi:hypothetical protein
MANDASRLRAAMQARQRRTAPGSLRNYQLPAGTGRSFSNVAGTLGDVVKAAIIQPADDAWWSVTHPKQRLLGQGRAAGGRMEVPWVAGSRWFHGSSRQFEKFNPALADKGALYGPGHYITDNPKVASSYAAERDTMGNWPTITRDQAEYTAKRLERESGYRTEIVQGRGDSWVVKYYDDSYGPNVTQYSFAPKRIFNVEKTLSKQDTKRLMRGMLDAAKRDPNPPEGLQWNASAKLIAKEWTKDLGPGRAANLDMVYADLSRRFGKPFANAAIRRAGYDAIRYPGGRQVGGLGDHNAMVVLNPKTLVRGGRPKPPKP